MLIYSPDRQLHVLQILQKTTETAAYICTDLAEEESRTYILNGCLNTGRYQKLIPLIMRSKNDCFTDFVEYFSADGVFYMLFRYRAGIPVMQKAEHEGMERRMEYVRCMLEQIILQSLPPEFQYDVLRPERILITEKGKLRFLYMPDTDFGSVDRTFHDVELRICQMIEMILMPELSMRYSTELSELVRDLRNGGVFQDHPSLYTRYTSIQRSLIEQKGHLVSHKRKFLVWENVKKFLVAFRYVAAVIVIIAAFALIGYQTFVLREKKADTPQLTRIGTQTIDENQPATTDSTAEEKEK